MSRRRDPEESREAIKTDRAHQDFPVVGIGASAGGLAAFEAFFSGMPQDSDTGMAFVLVQHLAPDHKSILTDLVRKYTRMKVFEVEDGVAVRPDCAYIIPPGRDMAFLNGTLQLLPPGAPRGQRMPIDFFFRSLAQDQRENAIGIVLSGTGTDGTLGIRAIKGEGGMAMAQNPASTEFDGMPRSAIATGLVDYELPPTEMPAQLMAYTERAFHRTVSPVLPEHQTSSVLEKVFVVLRSRTGHDFSRYKPSTIQRRIHRRMAVHQIETMEDYLKFIQQSSQEVDALFRDMLIGVTSFFRDREAFKALKEKVIPELFTGKQGNHTIRIWVPGCSTGEEAYSLAILLAEHKEALKDRFKVVIFATDIDGQAIATARAGIYPASIAADLTPERLERFFAPEPGNGAYCIHKNIRKMLVFSEQNVINDPPFSRLDLISCRNLLIYLGGDLQKKLIPLFHYALRPGGYLFLGSSETIGEFQDLFEALDRRNKLFKRKETLYGIHHGSPGRFLPPITALPLAAPGKKKQHSRDITLRELTEQALMEEIFHAGALVNARGDILYLHGRTGRYLELAPGTSEPNNILKMAREGLRLELAASLRKAAGTGETVHHPGLHVKTNGDFATVNLTVRPVAADGCPSRESPLYLVILELASASACNEQMPSPDGKSSTPSSGPYGEDTLASIKALKQELRAKEEYLQTANEELETSNEEMQSINEELQSTNEELETSKEELQSVNEELTTINTELETKVTDLQRANNDMNNLLAGTGIATVFLDPSLHILRFTSNASKIINLIHSDVGRPVSHIVSNLSGYDRLADDTKAVLDTLIPMELDVQTTEGRWYSMRIQPYRTLDNVIEGAVLTFVDITESKKLHEGLRVNEERLRIALGAASISVFNQDAELRYTWIHNPIFGLTSQQIIGKTDADLLPEKEAAELTAVKGRVLETGTGTRRNIRSTAAERSFMYDLTVEPLRDAAGNIMGITCAAIDVTAQQSRDGKKSRGDP